MMRTYGLLTSYPEQHEVTVEGPYGDFVLRRARNLGSLVLGSSHEGEAEYTGSVFLDVLQYWLIVDQEGQDRLRVPSLRMAGYGHLLSNIYGSVGLLSVSTNLEGYLRLLRWDCNICKSVQDL